MKKIFLIVFASIFITGCGVVNNFNIVKNDLADMLTPHPLKVKESDKESILNSGMGIVDLDFGKNAETTWKKIDDNGTFSDMTYRLTYYSGGSDGRVNSKLEPGTYFMSGIRFLEGARRFKSGGYMVASGTSAYTLESKIHGWDSEENRAQCFSFTLEAGEYLYIPNIKITYVPKIEGDNICHKLSFVEEETPETDSYYIGDLSK